MNLRSRRSIKKWVMAPPPVLALALPSETGRVLSIQSHTVQVSLLNDGFEDFFVLGFLVLLGCLEQFESL